MKKFVLQKLKEVSETILAWKYMKKCIIVKSGKSIVLSRSYAIKELSSFYSHKELKKLSLPDLIYLYVGTSSGGTEVYQKETGTDIYVGYAS